MRCKVETPQDGLYSQYLTKLYVPGKALELYKSTSPWSTIANIYAFVDKIEMPEEILIGYGKEKKLDCKIDPEGVDAEALTWSSYDAGIASVSQNGTVKGNRLGDTFIKLETTDGSDLSVYCYVTVGIPVEDIQLSQTAATVKPDETLQLTATVTPDDALNKELTWSSSDESVAIVTQDGFVLALAEGETIITAKTTDGSNLSVSCALKVSDAAGIEGVVSDSGENTTYYQLNGIKLAGEPQKDGVYVKEKNGVREKVVIKGK